MATVNGLPYLSITPDGGGGGGRTPPPWLLKLAIRLTPALRRAERRLTEVFTERPWVQGIAAWYDHDRGEAVGRTQALAGVDPDALDADGLAGHLEATLAEALRSMRQHILLHAHDTVPPGLFVVTAAKWGLAPAEAFDLLRVAVSGRRAASLGELRALDHEVAEALDDYLLIHGWRVIDGYDVDCSCLAEVPALVLRLAVAPARPDDAPDREARLDAARARVPASVRAEFDRLLADARAAYGLRDDNGAILVARPIGLLRRAMLAAGRRLQRDSRLSDSLLAIEAMAEELIESLRLRVPPGDPALAARADGRSAFRRSSVRPVLPDSSKTATTSPSLPRPGRLRSSADTAVGDAREMGHLPVEGREIIDAELVEAMMATCAGEDLHQLDR